MHIPVNGDGALLACGDRVNGELRAGDNVAAREHVGLARLIARQRYGDGPLRTGRHGNAVQVDLLPNGGDDRGNAQRIVYARADGLSVPQLHSLYPERLRPAVTEDLNGGGEEAEGNAFLDGFFDLLVRGGHGGAVAAVNDRNVRAEPDGGAGYIDGNIAAADDGNGLADLRRFAEIDRAQEIDAGHNARQLFADAAELRAAGRADGEIERLEALGAQRVERNVRSDGDAGLELHAQIAENVDFGADNVLFQPEGGDAQREHAAEFLFLLEYGHGIPLEREVVGAGKPCGAGADDGNLFLIGLAGLVDHFGNEAVFGLQILLGNEFFDIVDGNGRIDAPAGAGVLARFVADAAADGREGVLFLDELESLGIAALRGELYVALHRNMRRTLRLARRGAGGHGVGTVGAVIGVVAFLIPRDLSVGFVGVGDVRIGETALLAEADGICLAVFHALTAGDALVLIDTGDKVGADAVRRAEHLGDAQREARAAAAVADGGNVVKAGGLVHFVDEAVVLGALEDLVSLFLGNEAVLAVLGEADGVVVEIEAHILFKMTAALAHQAAGTAAGAGADGDRPRLIDQCGELVVGGFVRVVFNGAHNGHNAHEVYAVAEHGSQHTDADAGILLKARAELGVRVTLLTVGENALHDARYPDRVVVTEHAIADARAYDTRLNELVALCLHKFNALFRLFGEILHGEVGFQTHAHHNGAHVVIDDGIKDLVLGIAVGNAGVRHTFETDLGCESKNVRSVCHGSRPPCDKI